MFCSVRQTKTSEASSNVCESEISPWAGFFWVNKWMCSLTARQQVQTCAEETARADKAGGGSAPGRCPLLLPMHIRAFQPGSRLLLGQEPGQAWGSLDVLLGSPSPSRPSGNPRRVQTRLFPQKGPVVTNLLFPAVSCVILEELIRKVANK